MNVRFPIVPWLIALLWLSAVSRRFLLLDQTLPTQLLITLLSIAGIPFGLYLFIHGFVALRRKRLIQNTPTSTVRAAAMGLVEICGRAVGPYTLMAPLSACECYYYRTTAWESKDAQGHKARGKTIDEILCVPFFVEDKTGRLMIDPRGAETGLPAQVDESCSPAEAAGYVREFLLRGGMAGADLVRLQERCIRPGEELYILGTLSERSSSDEAELDSRMSEPSFRILSEAAADLQRRLVLESMGVSTPEPYRPNAMAMENFDIEPPVVLRKSDHAPFLISSRSEKEVLAQLDWTAILCIWGGPAVSLISVAILLQILGWW